MNLILFTDLDGTLLDHDGYGCDAALPALARLRARGVPVVPASSKTRAEIEPIRRRLGLDGPFVVENGAAVFFPESAAGAPPDALHRPPYRIVRLGVDYADIRRFVAAAAARHSIRGFGDMTRDEIAARTGLGPDEAASAQAREFSEPFVWEGPADWAALHAAAAGVGLDITRGGRFHHLIGAGQDKGRAVGIVRDALTRERGPVTTVGLGDGLNDLPLLQAVDVPVLIPHSDGSFEPAVDLPRLQRAPLPGSAGWNAAVLRLLSDLTAGEALRAG